MRFIKSTSQLSPAVVWNTLSPWDDCPWVVIGNLYVSVCFTGNDSWESMAHYLHTKGQNNFSILTGRHGDQLGQKVVNGKFINRTDDEDAINPVGDKILRNKMISLYPRMNIRIVDVGNGNHNTVPLLTNEIKRQLSENRIVILAWCYSLSAQKEGWDESVKKRFPQVFFGADKVPIGFTAKDWAWVNRYGKSAASIAAEQIALP
ncbi:hypothetical protein [Hahella sp. HN01]|uniref:hypothetical protein n=1 Tax=Hahella sp. HN01 TaxID=2847262 RepID=UPI001C1EFA99|nr:hypothetical protein [Hahella sp. HN01]MBU6956048.1 hypothetical protein [Hahella sp. HN01]